MMLSQDSKNETKAVKMHICDKCNHVCGSDKLLWIGEVGDGEPVCPKCWGFTTPLDVLGEGVSPDDGEPLKKVHEELLFWAMVKAFLVLAGIIGLIVYGVMK